ncbi:hypothetical protein Cgig2_030554 [Carnegiea gigantea]|uniref:Uncharacterized protein n=1 Tax=Carnegiea gigantea TaxID=171969 RepID=A0A9Q1JNJ0_9CARY|nr:hypothetical protein Cgig2_030554 [Carnegiea gigantea]
MRRKKTYSNNIMQDTTLKEGAEACTHEIEEVEGAVEDGVKGEVEDTHVPFKDSKEKLKIQRFYSRISLCTELRPKKGVLVDPQPRFKNKPSQAFEGQLQRPSHVPSHDSQLQNIINHYSIEGGLDHFRNVEVVCGFLCIRKSEGQAELLVILRKRSRRTRGPPQVPLKGFPNMVSRLLSTMKCGKNHDEEEESPSL